MFGMGTYRGEWKYNPFSNKVFYISILENLFSIDYTPGIGFQLLFFDSALLIENQKKNVGQSIVERAVIQGNTFEQHDILYVGITIQMIATNHG
jgi:hypothetical protein